MMLRCPAFGDVVYSHGILEMPLTTLEIRCSTGVYVFSRILFVFILKLVLFVSIIILTVGFLGGNYAFYDMSAQHTVTWNQMLCFCIGLFSFCWMSLLIYTANAVLCNDMF
jgi:hypothetical protein